MGNSDPLPATTFTPTYPYKNSMPIVCDAAHPISLSSVQNAFQWGALLACRGNLKGVWATSGSVSLLNFREQNKIAYDERVDDYNTGKTLAERIFYADPGYNNYTDNGTNMWTRYTGWGNNWSSLKMGPWTTLTMYDGYGGIGYGNDQGNFAGNYITLVTKRSSRNIENLNSFTKIENDPDPDAAKFNWDDRISSATLAITPFDITAYS